LIQERLAETDALLAVSSYHADWAARRFGLDRERVRVVLSGIEIEPRPSARVREAGAPLTIVYLARLAPEKGLDVLVEAFCRLAKRPGLETTRLEVAGYLGTDQVSWVGALRRRLASDGLASRARFLATITPDAKRDLLERADVFCVPTRHPEPKGLFAFEALASGVPLVLPDHGAFPELLARAGGGLLVPPLDVDALASTLETVLLDPSLRERLSAEGRAAAESYFHSGRMAQETIEIYREVLARR
jgi:glycosyltransferase involved in cell wall biosynthesis